MQQTYKAYQGTGGSHERVVEKYSKSISILEGAEAKRSGESMIKKVAALVVLVVIVSLTSAGCVSNTQQTTSNTGGSSPVVSLNVNSVTTSTQLGSPPLGSTPSAGNKYVIIDVTVNNLNKNDLYIGNPLYFKLTTSDGTVYSYSPSSYFLSNRLTGVSNTNPGDKVTGEIAFEVPQSVQATKLTYGDGFNAVVSTTL